MTDYLWDYGDSITSATAAVTHTHVYTASGVYTVSLTATGPGGSDTLTRTNYVTTTTPQVLNGRRVCLRLLAHAPGPHRPAHRPGAGLHHGRVGLRAPGGRRRHAADSGHLTAMRRSVRCWPGE
ncbi:MAG: PKD domain-containing protein [Anaerolineae bacterium]|nr:PKD domain-containing protein [Anaerolineae bacterium]